jgi:hypothetical protein
MISALRFAASPKMNAMPAAAIIRKCEVCFIQTPIHKFETFKYQDRPHVSESKKMSKISGRKIPQFVSGHDWRTTQQLPALCVHRYAAIG